MKNKEKIIGSIVILCISIIFIIAGYTLSSPKENVTASDYEDIFVENGKSSVKEVSVKSESEALVTEAAMVEDTVIKVDIKGAVKVPGVYEIKKGSRVDDLIKLAGGATIDAELGATNLSTKLNDEDCVVIYKKGEEVKIQNFKSSTDSSAKNTTVSNSSDKSDTININTAEKEELMTLTGIGDVKADAIIKYREENGGFKSVEELMKTGGIGEKTLSKFRDMVDIK